MKEHFVLTASHVADVALTTITSMDCEDLRSWKNANRQFFFFREEITPAMQSAWFSAYTEREEDWMFVVAVDGATIGCMGFRVLGSVVDVYNIMRGRPDGMSRTGVMGDAFRMMCRFIAQTYSLPITARVLQDNPAVGWYERQGFVTTGTHEDYVLMELQKDTLGREQVVKTRTRAQSIPKHSQDADD